MPVLHPLCTHHAVIASRRPRILGTAAPGSPVTVEFAGQTVSATADTAGHWRADFPPLPAGGPHVLVARDASAEAFARDVLVGEVWLGSGQSNMEWSLAQTKDSDTDILAADEPRLRMFMVGKANTPDGPVDHVGGRWQVCTPHEAATLSAVGYFFGRKMVAETGLPFGIVVSAWGGSCIAPWLPGEVLHSRREYASFLAERDVSRANSVPPPEYVAHTDPGIAPHAAAWSEPAHDDSAWATLQVPGQWQDAGWGFNGAVWFRRTVTVPAAWVGRDLELYLGIVDDFDRTFVNGVQVGAMGAETPNWWSTPRFHTIPAALVTGTTLHIAVRVFDIWGGGGIMGSPHIQPLDTAAKTPPLKLSGPWSARAELELPLRFPGGPPVAPTGLWNAMIHPLLGFTVNGFLWYQGESDVTRARLYPRLLSDLITIWRRAFDSPEAPFGIVQLAAYKDRKAEPSEDDWADLREAQRLVALHTPACGLALAIDAGEAGDIHPRYKKTVGGRLALWALRQAYGRNAIAYSGPLPAEYWPEGDGLRMRFTHAEGLRVRGDGLRGFELAGDDGRWCNADTALLSGDTVFVRAAAIRAPRAVRYAWQANPETTLENAAGLPAVPFRLPCA